MIPLPRPTKEQLKAVFAKMNKKDLVELAVDFRLASYQTDEMFSRLLDFIEAIERKGKLPGVLLPVKALFSGDTKNLPKEIEAQHKKDFKPRAKALKNLLKPLTRGE